MTAQLLASELSNLIQESKRKHNDLRQVPLALPFFFFSRLPLVGEVFQFIYFLLTPSRLLKSRSTSSRI
jgi:hypothetical protein